MLLQALADDPGNPGALAFLATVEADLELFEESEQHARAAIELEPTYPEAHAALARTLVQLPRRSAEALASAQVAVELDPEEPNHHALVAQVHIQRKDWEDALVATAAALEQVPEHNLATNLRAVALRQLGRNEEADEVLTDQLHRTPTDSTTHTNVGWSQLRAANYQRAEEHFREALAIDPNDEWAQEGIRHSLQARHWFYRPVLQFFLWLSRLKETRQTVVLIGAYLVYRVLSKIARESDGPIYVLAISGVVAYLIFVALTWFADVVSGALLALHPSGKLAFGRFERRWCLFVTGLLLLCAGLFAYGRFAGATWAYLPAVGCLVLALPCSRFHHASPGKPKQAFGAFCVLFLVLGLVASGLFVPAQKSLHAHNDLLTETQQDLVAEGIIPLDPALGLDYDATWVLIEGLEVGPRQEIYEAFEQRVTADPRCLDERSKAAAAKRVQVAWSIIGILGIVGFWATSLVFQWAERRAYS